jgi:FkbM family methyltransferase
MLGNFEQELEKILEEYKTAPKQDPLEAALAESDSRLVIYGAGGLGCMLSVSKKIYTERLVAFCDSYKQGDSALPGIPIITPEELAENYHDAIVVVAVADLVFNDEIYDKVISLGFPKERVCRKNTAFGLYTLGEFGAHYNGYKWAYEFFEDEKSKNIVLNRIRCYLFFCEMEHSPPKEQYFEKDLVNFTENEIFADGGCFTGDIAAIFFEKVNNRYKHYYGFEPDAENLRAATTNLAGKPNVTLVAKGLWNVETRLNFRQGFHGFSTINEAGIGFIETVTLDGYFKDKEPPTFIKMDIEGAEKNALIGGERIIRENMPKLAICVYHKPEDIYELPRIIAGYNSGYRFTLRHYKANNGDMVCYAL